MKCDIVIAGVGGQGILTIATILGRASLDAGWHVKQSEVHGMAQRGGSVYSHMRIASDEIHSDAIARGRADMLIAMEPMEGLRYLPYLSSRGWLIVNEMPAINIPDYPPAEEINREIRAFKNHVLFDASKLASENGSARAVNVALLGAAAPFTGFSPDLLERAISAQFASKGDAVVGTNLAVFRAARAMAEGHAAR
jgi:indolepyruvate ferredoxin oxidoreductase, beta subunit